MKKNRSTLKEYFKKGAIPTESNFADLIDSMLNQDEDNISKLPNDPLRVTAVGAEEALLNFYRVEQNQDKLSWQVKQKPGGKAGLSFGDESGSRLFLESGTGKLGLGTTTPNSKLDVLNEARTGTHPTAIKGLYVTGAFGPDSDGVEFRHSNGTQGIGFGYNTIYATGSSTDQNLGLKPRGAGKVIVSGPLQVSGSTLQLDGNQKIYFSDTDATNNLKIQLWSGYGLGINGGTLFYAANGKHSWRDNAGANERMALTTGADGGLSVLGTGVSSFAGSVGINTTNTGSFKLSVNGDLRASRYIVQDSVDGGPTKGIWMWNSGDSNWGIYMGTAGAGKSLAGNAATGGDGFTSHAIRIRTYAGDNNGLIYENNNEQLNFSVRGNSGNGYFRGALSLGNSDLYFTKADHDHTGFGNAEGYAAIENAKNYSALMILGRSIFQGGKLSKRVVKLWDYLEVNGNLKTTGYTQGNHIYFSAYLDSNSRSGALNPLPMQAASQNVGGCYDTNSSKFTAPVKGLYLFTMCGLRADGSDSLSWHLMVNGNFANSGGTTSSEPSERSLMTWNGSGTHASRTILLNLNQGDTVWVQQSGSGRCDNFRSGFEGALLSASLD